MGLQAEPDRRHVRIEDRERHHAEADHRRSLGPRPRQQRSGAEEQRVGEHHIDRLGGDRGVDHVGLGRHGRTKKVSTLNRTKSIPRRPRPPGSCACGSSRSKSASPVSGTNSAPDARTRSAKRVPVMNRTRCPRPTRWRAMTSSGVTCPWDGDAAKSRRPQLILPGETTERATDFAMADLRFAAWFLWMTPLLDGLVEPLGGDGEGGGRLLLVTGRDGLTRRADGRLELALDRLVALVRLLVRADPLDLRLDVCH